MFIFLIFLGLLDRFISYLKTIVREMKGKEVTQELQVIGGLENGTGKWNKIILLKMPS